MSHGNRQSVYETLSRKLGLKFKAQIKNSGIQLRSLDEVNTTHCRLVTNIGVIAFSSPSEFLAAFVSLLRDNLSNLNDDLENVFRQKRHDTHDEVALDYEEEGFCHQLEKQKKLLARLLVFQKHLAGS